ncbi:type II secretion system protein [Succinimonas amylolytica]|uniref:type II secretion system protein n=1 Tax=Succinimonas amylolytica TaxID=83769 RepID=UPI0003A3EF12|nr:prepilin-type N-terminal cleavage/methylation domain-containing protein [Succinimonas amylolytica]
MNTTPSSGFTLIELVVVIVILGILAATAAPKFMNLRGDARAAAIHGLEGVLKSADSVVYSKAVILGKDKDLNAEFTVEDRVVRTRFGHLMDAHQIMQETDADLVNDWFVSPKTSGDYYELYIFIKDSGLTLDQEYRDLYQDRCSLLYKRSNVRDELIIKASTSGC